MTEKLNILVAYPYFNDAMLRYLSGKDPASFRLIVDSGAFTAWNTGAKITMEGYTSFLKVLPAEWEIRAVQLDVYGNPEATYENWKRMLDLGLTDIMPVFTRGDTLERLEEFYSATDYVMFGGIAFGGENKNYIKWFSEANKGRKVHWLGFTDMRFIKHFKPTSVDSSSALQGQRYGRMSYYSGGGVLDGLDKKAFAQRPPIEFLRSSERLGFTLAELKTLGQSEAWRGAAKGPNPNSPRGFASFVCHAHHVWRAIEVERKIGTRIYFAGGSPADIGNIFDVYAFMQDREAI